MNSRPSGGIVLARAEYAALPWSERQWRRLPIVDRETGVLSITRIIALAVVAIVWHAIEDQHPISGTQLSALVTAAAIAFGKSTFSFWLTKMSFNATAADTTSDAETRTIIDQTTRTITERRDPALGIEPTL